MREVEEKLGRAFRGRARFDRPVEQSQPGSGGAADLTKMTYDPNGNMLKREKPRNAEATIASSTSGPAIWRMGYDEVDRLLSQTNPEGDKTTYGYDAVGNRILERSAKGNAIGLSDYRCPREDPTPDPWTTCHFYDAADQLIEDRDGLGQRTFYGFDDNGNQTSVDRPGPAAALTPRSSARSPYAPTTAATCHGKRRPAATSAADRCRSSTTTSARRSPSSTRTATCAGS